MAGETQVNQGPALPPQAGIIGEQETRQITGRGSADQGHSVQTGGTQQATKKLTPAARVTGGEVLDDVRECLRTFKQDTDDYVRKNPAKTIFIALGIGFVLGLMGRR